MGDANRYHTNKNCVKIEIRNTFLLGLVDNAEETSSLSSSVPDSDGVYFIPAFSGLGVSYIFLMKMILLMLNL